MCTGRIRAQEDPRCVQAGQERPLQVQIPRHRRGRQGRGHHLPRLRLLRRGG